MTALELQSVLVGVQSETLLVKFGVPQGSVLGHTLFSLFCNDLPDIVEDCDGEIHIYADNIKIYVTASSPDMVVFALNVILQKLYDWCCLNRLIPPPPGRTEYMMSVHPVKSTRCLGNEINSDLNWNVHVKEFISPFHKN